ncbi:sensor histidine kinase [Roseivivax sp. CAU 1761]
MAAELLEDAPCGIVVTAPDGELRYVNATLAGWLGLPVGGEGGRRRLGDLLTLPGRLYFETHIAPMMRLQGFVREISCALRCEDGSALPVLLSGVTRRDAAGIPARMDYTIFDARERSAYEGELRAARHAADELAAIIRTSPNAILRVEADGRVGSWNLGAERMMGLPPEAAIGRPVAEVIALAGRPGWFAEAAARREAGETVFETRIASGAEVELTLAPIAASDPLTPPAWSVILRDISARKAAERQLRMLVGEMKHRIKNTLGVVCSIARQTLPAEASGDFIARLQALSRAHDALAEGSAAGADLGQLLARTAEEAGGPERCRVEGPAVRLTERQATSLAMALHELVTNAMKYGALSVAGGVVSVRYGWEGAPGDGPVRLCWQERGGPPVTPPTRRGFGTRMIALVLQAELAAEVRFDFPAEGCRCDIVFTPG